MNDELGITNDEVLGLSKLQDFVEKKSIRAESLPNFESMKVVGVSNQIGITATNHKKSNDLSKYQLIEEGDFAYNPYRINVGSIGLVPQGLVGLVSPAYVVFRTKNLLPELLLDFLKSNDGLFQIGKYARGTVRKALRFEDLCQIEMQIPSIEKQSTILKKKKNVDTEINILKTELNHQQTLLKKLRQHILQEAIEGKLTEEFRIKKYELREKKLRTLNDKLRKASDDKIIRNFELKISNYNASALLECIRKEKSQLIKERKIRKQKPLPPISEDEKSFTLPEGWVWCRLQDITLLITDGKHGDCQNLNNSGYYFLSAKDIQNGKLLYLNARQIVPDEFQEVHNRTNLEAGDICMVNTGATVGKLALAQQFPDSQV